MEIYNFKDYPIPDFKGGEGQAVRCNGTCLSVILVLWEAEVEKSQI